MAGGTPFCGVMSIGRTLARGRPTTKSYREGVEFKDNGPKHMASHNSRIHRAGTAGRDNRRNEISRRARQAAAA